MANSGVTQQQQSGSPGTHPAATKHVGFLHPGAMGSAMAAACRGRGLWVSDGRSGATAQRAGDAQMTAVASFEQLAEQADIIISICPPHAAMEVATQVAAVGFGGTYVDANAISPETARAVADLVEHFVDASVIGPPPTQQRQSRLYLCGDRAPAVARLWEDSALQPVVLDAAVPGASALKMAYASWTKGSAALLLSAVALADAEGVGPALMAEWDLSQPDLPQRTTRTVQGVGPKGWRFVGEMNEIAESMSNVGLPTGFHLAAAEVYERLAELRGRGAPSVDEVLTLLGARSPDNDATQDSSTTVDGS